MSARVDLRLPVAVALFGFYFLAGFVAALDAPGAVALPVAAVCIVSVLLELAWLKGGPERVGRALPAAPEPHVAAPIVVVQDPQPGQVYELDDGAEDFPFVTPDTAFVEEGA